MALPSQSDLIAAIRELLDAFAEPTEDGAREERCLLAIARQGELLDQADQGPASAERSEKLKGGTEEADAGPPHAFPPSAMRMH